MYSIVLATALTAGSAMPAWGWGCHGCWGGCRGCWGCSGCSGYGCHGCSGCWGGSGCSCYGGWGCYGGCWGSCYGGWSSCYGCHGCYGCYGCYGGCHGCIGLVIVPGATGVPQAAPAPAPKKETGIDGPAKVIVKAPLDVKVTVNGQETPRTATEAAFRTPSLQAGQLYSYEFKGEVVRDGKPVTQTKRVYVQAGQESRVDFSDLAAPARAADRVARVKVVLPADAKLYVDGVALELRGATRSFETPQLEPGQKYSYTLTAEVLRDGQKRDVVRTVTVEAGKEVTVDFKDLVALQSASR